MEVIKKTGAGGLVSAAKSRDNFGKNLKAFSPFQTNTLKGKRFLLSNSPLPLYRALSHDVPAFANKTGQPIEVTRLQLAAQPSQNVSFCARKAARSLAGHLAGSVMTEANTWVDPKQHKWTR